MNSSNLNFLSTFLILSLIGGIAIHDTHVDKFSHTDQGTLLAAVSEKDNPHTHAERLPLSRTMRSVGSSEPLVRPRGISDKKYILRNRLGSNNYESNYIWPSI